MEWKELCFREQGHQQSNASEEDKMIREVKVSPGMIEDGSFTANFIHLHFTSLFCFLKTAKQSCSALSLPGRNSLKLSTFVSQLKLISQCFSSGLIRTYCYLSLYNNERDSTMSQEH